MNTNEDDQTTNACDSGNWDALCDDCKFYAAQDVEV